MAKEFIYRGKPFEEIKKLSLKEFALLLPARARRTLTRGISHAQQRLLEHIKAKKQNLKTHCREMIIIPDMVGNSIKVYTGKEWHPLMIEKEMMGHRLGEFALTRKRVQHSAPGIGATRSSASLSV